MKSWPTTHNTLPDYGSSSADQTIHPQPELPKKVGIKFNLIEGDNSPYIDLDNPIIISAFAGFVKTGKKMMASFSLYRCGSHLLVNSQ